MKRELRIAALGDISFMGARADEPTMAVFEQVMPYYAEADLVVGNLECPLLTTGSAVAGKCTLHGHTDWAKILKKSGISLVSLANNHMMDYSTDGLSSTIDALREAGILFVGAGRNLQEANAPVYMTIKGHKIAFLGRTSVEVSSPSYADLDTPGVAFFKEDEVVPAIRGIASKVDLVVVMLHWGMEEYNYPSSQQRAVAEEMINAGAGLILGHHPHVIQGTEKISRGLVAYSLGNFLFDSFDWRYNLPSGETRQVKFKLTAENRQGMILAIQKTADNGGLTARPIFTNVNGSGLVVPDTSIARIRLWENLCKRLEIPLYNYWWLMYALKMEYILRLGGRLGSSSFLKKLTKLRPHHLLELKTYISKACRIATGKSMNPYE